MAQIMSQFARFKLYLKKRAMIRAYAKEDEAFERYQDELERDGLLW